jgi:hypothetical protein
VGAEIDAHDSYARCVYPMGVMPATGAEPDRTGEIWVVVGNACPLFIGGSFCVME